nr:MAG TPA: hypothetical protein [Caudoviricetes sp.]
MYFPFLFIQIIPYMIYLVYLQQNKCNNYD